MPIADMSHWAANPDWNIPGWNQTMTGHPSPGGFPEIICIFLALILYTNHDDAGSPRGVLIYFLYVN
jgi:hypothetical protein